MGLKLQRPSPTNNQRDLSHVPGGVVGIAGQPTRLTKRGLSGAAVAGWNLGLAFALTLAGCKGEPKASAPTLAAAQDATAERPIRQRSAPSVPMPVGPAAAATLTEPELPPATPLAVRQAVAQIPVAAPAAGVRLGERWGVVWRADRHWQARALDAAGRTVWDAPAVSAPDGPIDAVVATGAGGTVWVAAANGLQVACLHGSGHGGVKLLRTPLVGLVGQADGSAVLALTDGSGTTQMARLKADFSADWQTSVALPGPPTVVAATLRDDLLLVGRSQAGAPGWWAARVSHADGSLAWVRTIPVKAMAADAELVAAAPSSRGTLLYGAAPKAPLHWTVTSLDANGHVEWSVLVDRRAPRVVAAAAERGSWMAQTRDGQVAVRALDPAGKAGEILAAYALDLEEPLAVGSDGSDGRAAWLISRAPHPTGSGSELLFTRWTLGEGTAAPGCEPGPCQAVRFVEGRCARVTLSDGAACGSSASCAAGQCVRRRP